MFVCSFPNNSTQTNGAILFKLGMINTSRNTVRGVLYSFLVRFASRQSLRKGLRFHILTGMAFESCDLFLETSAFETVAIHVFNVFVLAVSTKNAYNFNPCRSMLRKKRSVTADHVRWL
jgi:hypothetical protein